MHSDTLTEFRTAIQSAPDHKAGTLRPIRKTFSQKIKNWPPGDVLEFAYVLLGEGGSTYRWLAYELIHYHKPTLRSLDAPTLEKLGEGMSSWDQVDTFATYLSGVAWRAGQISDEIIHRWAHSADRWWRRAALVSTIPLNTRARGGKGDVPRTLAVCDLLLTDRDDMVVKALSWALRELIIWDEQAVAAYLNQHEDSLAPRVLREVRNKLDTGLKNP